MNKLSPRLLCYIYVLLVLLTATILSALPHRLVALILLLVMLFVTFYPVQPKLNVVIIVVAIFLVPLTFEPLLDYLTYNTWLPPRVLQLIVAIGALPVIYLLDCNLKQNAQDMTLTHNINKRRYPTVTLRALFGSALAVLLISFIVSNPILLYAAIFLILYLLVVLIRVLCAVPELPLDVPTIRKRIIAGTTADIPLYATSKVSIRLHSVLNPVDQWAKVTPERLTLNKTKVHLNLTVTPPLAGPSHPQLQVSVVDPWGFIQVDQVIEPIELHVIPRARYAEWLAMKYLEKTGMGDVVATAAPKVILTPKRGIEYFDSRTYQPGDPLRDINWKHSLKLNQLIVNQYIEAGGQAAIIMVNLSVTDAEEADKLAFNLITTALTLAQETIPSTLAVYNHQEVVLITPVIAPREALKQTLLLVKDITLVEFTHRFLQPPDISKLRRNITLLRQATSQPAQRLLGMLDFEYRAIGEAAKNHPASVALRVAAKQTSPPAIIAVVSTSKHDAEALMVTTEKLTNRGFTTVYIEAAKH